MERLLNFGASFPAAPGLSGRFLGQNGDGFL
jgi:hypothetical protein